MSQKTVINLILGVALLAAACFGFACSGAGDNKLADTTSTGSGEHVDPSPLILTSGDVTLDERVRIIREHSSGGDNMFSHIILRFDSRGVRTPMETIPGGEALQVAAMYYAISTLDFEVSLAELISAGYWPYNNFPDNVRDDMLVYDCPVSIPVMSADGELTGGHDFDSNRWITDARRVILSSFYRSCESDWEARSLETLEKNEQFWINPFTQSEMQYGSNAGDLFQRNLGDVVNSMPFSKPKEYKSELLLDFINQEYLQLNDMDEEQPASSIIPRGTSIQLHSDPANPCLAYTPDTKLRSVSSDQCCLYERVVEEYAANHEHSYSWCCRCTDTTDNCCDFSWTVSSTSYAIFWAKVRCVDCDHTPGTNQIVLSSGARAPDTLIGWTGTVTNPVADCDPITHCIHMSDPCWTDRSNFWTNVQNTPPLGGGTSLPGPLCDC